MFYTVTDLVITILEATCCQIFFDIFYNEQTDFRRVNLDMVAVLSLGGTSYLTARMLRGHFLIKQMIVFLLIVGVMTFIKGFYYKKSIVLSILFQGLLVAMEYTAYMFVSIIIPNIEDMSTSQEVIGRIITIIDVFFCFMCILLIRRIFETHKNKVIFDDEWLKYILFPIITIIMLAVMLASFKTENDLGQMQVFCGVGLGLVVLNFLLFNLLEDVIRHEEKLREKQSLEIQSSNQMEMYSKLMETFKVQRAEAHEFKNHLLCIQSLAGKGKIDELNNYIQDINGEMQMNELIIDTNNEIINTVINTKYKEAAAKHIAVVFRVNDLSGVQIEDKDLVVLLSNLFNNAIEASVKCKEEKVIQFKMIHEYGNTILSLKNNYSEPIISIGNTFLTTKKHGKNFHGVGINNAIQIIRKYDGTYDISTDNNEFFFSVLIPEE